MRFIHAADLHIDSPLVGLTCYEGCPAAQLREATRKALENLVGLALSEQVDFVIIAGDLFDGPWQDMQTGLFTAKQFRRLGAAQIPVFLVRGNHDAQSRIRSSIPWPENVHEFAVRKAETRRLQGLKVAIHGRSFADPEVRDDPVPDYPAAVPGLFNIGVLHTNVGGRAEHDPYAPTTLAILSDKGYDYWALGHVHQRSTLCEGRPYIAYSGNTQGRHVRECGAKGCLLVSVEEGQVRCEFRTLDVVRWHQVRVEAAESDSRAALLHAVSEKLRKCRQDSEGRLAAVRVTIAGRCVAHDELVSKAQREQFVAEVRDAANELDEEVWAEEIHLETLPPLDVSQLRQSADLVGDLLRQIDEVRGDPGRLAGLAEVLVPLEEGRAKLLAEAGITMSDPEAIRGWLADAERLLLGHLVGGESA